MNLKEYLTEARSYIEQGWHKGCYYRDVNGKSIYYWEKDAPTNACSYCILGALDKTTYIALNNEENTFQREQYDLYKESIKILCETLTNKTGYYSEDRLLTFNDIEASSREDILYLFDKAIKIL